MPSRKSTSARAQVSGPQPRDIPSNDDPDASLEADAALALRTFRRHVWLVCHNAPAHVAVLGRVATQGYAAALAATADPAAWRGFVVSVWLLVNELDRYPSRASRRWRDARGALCRIVVDNVDLLETASGAEARS